MDETYDFGQSINGNCVDTATSFETTTSALIRAENFHQYLIGYCSGVSDSPIDGDGLTATEQITFIDSYLNSKQKNHTISRCDYYSDSGNFLTVRTFIQNKINNNRPVIVNAYNHSTVAFAYDSNYIYFVTGYGYCSRLSYEDYLNSEFVIAIDIELSVNRVFSDNYYLSQYNTTIGGNQQFISISATGSYNINLPTDQTLKVQIIVPTGGYIGVYTTGYYNTSFENIECTDEYEYYDDTELIDSGETDYNAQIYVDELRAYGTLEFFVTGSCNYGLSVFIFI